MATFAPTLYNEGSTRGALTQNIQHIIADELEVDELVVGDLTATTIDATTINATTANLTTATVTTLAGTSNVINIPATDTLKVDTIMPRTTNGDLSVNGFRFREKMPINYIAAFNMSTTQFNNGAVVNVDWATATTVIDNISYYFSTVDGYTMFYNNVSSTKNFYNPFTDRAAYFRVSWQDTVSGVAGILQAAGWQRGYIISNAYGSVYHAQFDSHTTGVGAVSYPAISANGSDIIKVDAGGYMTMYLSVNVDAGYTPTTSLRITFEMVAL